jgi:hemolysin activation/secretion protein
LGTANQFLHPDQSTPHSTYVKPSVDIDVYQPLPYTFGGLLHTSLHGEWANTTLYAQDELQIGGLYTVRGYLQNSVLGDHGAYARNEISWKLPRTGIGRFDRLTGPMEAYVLFDGGWAEEAHPVAGLSPKQTRGAIAGTGAGLRSTDGPIFWDASLTHSVGEGPVRNEGYIGSFQIGMKF